MSTLIAVQLICWTPFALVTFLTNFTSMTTPSYYANEAGIFSKLFCVFSPIVLYLRDMRPFMERRRRDANNRRSREPTITMQRLRTSTEERCESTKDRFEPNDIEIKYNISICQYVLDDVLGK